MRTLQVDDLRFGFRYGKETVINHPGTPPCEVPNTIPELLISWRVATFV